LILHLFVRCDFQSSGHDHHLDCFALIHCAVPVWNLISSRPNRRSLLRRFSRDPAAPVAFLLKKISAPG
jgi:hypothetical protein